METLAGASVVAFFMVYLAFKLNNDDGDPWLKNFIFAMRFFLIMAATFILIFVPKSTLDSNDCKLITVNGTGTSVITVCPNSSSTTDVAFYTAYIWFVRVFITFLFLYLVFNLLLYARHVKAQKKM